MGVDAEGDVEGHAGGKDEVEAHAPPGHRGHVVLEEDLEELPEGTYYVRDLVGLTVIDDKSNEAIGKLTEVIQNTAQDVYRIELDKERYGEGKPDSLVPAVKEFIKEVNISEGYIKIHFIEGML